MKKIVKGFILFLLSFILVSCDNKEPNYKARFLNWDDSLIEERYVDTFIFEDIKNLPTPPDREGYTFEKWVSFFDSSTNVITIKAEYKANLIEDKTFTVKYNLNGGNWNLDNEQVVKYNNYITNVAPNKNMADFKGWLYNGVPFDARTPIKNDITLIASWEAIALEDILIGQWEIPDGTNYGQNPNFSSIKFSGVFVNDFGRRKSSFVNKQDKLEVFSLDGDNIIIGDVVYKLQYSNGKILLKSPSLSTIELHRVKGNISTSSLSWSLFRGFFNTYGEEEETVTGRIYKLETNMNTTITNYDGVEMRSTKENIIIRSDSTVNILFNFEDKNNPYNWLLVLVFFKYTDYHTSNKIFTNLQVYGKNDNTFASAGYSKINFYSFRNEFEVLEDDQLPFIAFENDFPNTNISSEYYIPNTMTSFVNYLYKNYAIELFPEIKTISLDDK